MIPSSLQYTTADEIAETYSGITPELYRKLWAFATLAQNPTPLGGDGSDGTVELPCGRLNLENDDKPYAWWDKLIDTEQQIIIEGAP